MRSAIKVVVFGIFILLASCQKNQDIQGASLQLDLPQTRQKLGSLSTNTLSRVSVYLSGPSITIPIFKVFEKCLDCSTPLSGPFEIDLPPSRDVLIQVVAVYEDPSVGSMDITYGDDKVSLEEAQENVTITVSSIATDVKMGKITGRYLDSATQGPSGIVEGYYTPPGKPAVKVVESEIINGWFQFIAIETLSINYKLASSGQTLFTDSSFASLDGLLGDKVMRIEVPTHYSVWSTHNGSSWVTDQARLYEGFNSLFLGFFGPGATNAHKACRYSYDWGSLPYRNIDVDGSSSTTSGDRLFRLCKDANCAQTLSFFGATTDPTQLSLRGGGVDASAQCTNSSLDFDSQLHFKNDYFGEADNSFAQFYGPFKIIPYGSNNLSSYVKFTYSVVLQELDLQWDYLPNIIGNGVDGVEVFYKKGATTQDEELIRIADGYNCEAARARGYTSAGFTSGNSQSLNGIHHSEFPSLSILVCPYRTKDGTRAYFRSAISPDVKSFDAGVSPLQVVSSNFNVDAVTSFDLNYATKDGVPPLSFTYKSGAGSVTSAGIYTPGAGSSVVNISDADGTNFDVTLTSVTATKDLDFTSSLPTAFSLSRTSMATFYNSDGEVETVAAHFPRFEYDPSNCTSAAAPRNCAARGLLLESASTNRFSYSEDFSQVYWNAGSYDPSVSTDGTVAPDGSTLATKAEDTNKDTNNWNADKFYVNTLPNCAENRKYIFSLFVKQGTAANMNISVQEAAQANADLYFNFASKTATSYDPHGVTELPNGWFRIWVSYKCRATASVVAWIGPASGQNSFEPSAFGYSYIWGAQMEIDEGDYPTSYIATTGSATMRTADILSGPASSAYFSNLSKGTFLLSYHSDGNSKAAPGTLLMIDQLGTGTGDRMTVSGEPGGGIRFHVTQSGSPSTNYVMADSQDSTDTDTLAFSYQSGEFNSALNGVDKYSVNSYSAPSSPSVLRFGSNVNSIDDNLDGHLLQLKYWPEPLGLPALQGLTD
ncbi:MAG: hypothetical protein KDD33_04165 [Bdellovibrionales bacterium]|nr:hypothetical protein [Bdellovibrionales bacterium]